MGVELPNQQCYMHVISFVMTDTNKGQYHIAMV